MTKGETTMTDTTTGAVEAIAQKITKPPISMCWFGDDAELLVGIMRALAAERDALAAQLAEAVRLLDKPDQSDGMAGRYHYEWHRVDEFLSRNITEETP
jgi:hypothetical protein